MKADAYEIGRVVASRQGHDRNRLFVVVALAGEGQVLIADGQTRKLAHPKRKRLKHLAAMPHHCAEALTPQHLRAGTADAAIRKALAPLTAQHNNEAKRKTNKEECALVQE